MFFFYFLVLKILKPILKVMEAKKLQTCLSQNYEFTNLLKKEAALIGDKPLL